MPVGGLAWTSNRPPLAGGRVRIEGQTVDERLLFHTL